MKRTTLVFLPVLFLALLQNNFICQTHLVSGRVSTGNQNVSYAAVVLYNSLTNTVVDSTTTDSFGYYQLNAVVSVDDDEPILPTDFELTQNYPNPFSDQTEILYKLNNQNDVTIKIYDILGREIKTFLQGEENIGMHGVVWDGTNNHGIKAVPGIYFYQLITNKEIQAMKMVYSPNGDSFSKTGNRFVADIDKFRLANKTNTVWNRYTFEIKSTDSTKPRIGQNRFADILIKRDTIINFNVYIDYFPLKVNNEWLFEYRVPRPWGDTLATVDYRIIATKKVYEKTFYVFDYSMPFFPNDLIIKDLDTILVRQNETGDIIFLADNSEWLYFAFKTELMDSLVKTKIKDVDYFFLIESVNDTVNTPIGNFDKCFRILNYFPDIKGTEHYTWFAPGYGPVKIYYPELNVTYQLVKVSIQNN